MNHTEYTRHRGVTDNTVRGYNIIDPTYTEALQFIASDQTDKNKYSKEKNYTCRNFAYDFKNNAINTGYRCWLVYIEFQEPTITHLIVCFNTTDSGIIFIEPQTDEIVNLTIGQPYWDRTKHGTPPYDDTIKSFEIIPHAYDRFFVSSSFFLGFEPYKF